MAYTTINKSTDYFNTKLYTGNNGTQSITGVGHQPDLIWVKARNDTANNTLTDAVRGTNSVLYTNQNQGIDAPTNAITSFDSDGFSVGSNGSFNANSINYASWNWKANGAGSSNTAGSLNSTVSVNTTAGFSIVKYTAGGSSAVSTIGHGLNAVPKVIMVKGTDANSTPDQWMVYHEALGNTKRIKLNSTDGSATGSGYWNNTTPTSSLFTVGSSSEGNSANGVYIAYCFAEKTGYSKFGKLISNGSDDGTFTYTGFAPKFVMLKPNVSDAWSHWYMFDTARDTNLNDKPLYANLATQEAYYGGSPATNYAQIDILSNGFKIRRDSNWGGGSSGRELIYMAFGQSLVGSNNVPCTAR